MVVTYSDLLASQAVRSAAEAVQLVLMAMRGCDLAGNGGTAVGLPGADQILLSRTGDVSFAARWPPANAVASAVALLRQLLHLDGDGSSGRLEVPGGLLLLIARASGQIDLPPLSYSEFRDALERFRSSDEQVLAAVYSRVLDCQTTEPRSTGRCASVRLSVPAENRHRPLFAAAITAGAALCAVLTWTHLPASDTRVAEDVVTVQTIDVRIPRHRWVMSGPASVNRISPHSIPSRLEALQLVPSDALGTDVFSPSFTRDPQILLFHSGRTRAAVMQATFDRPGHLTVAPLIRDGATNYHATLSPDGAWLAYDSDRDGIRGVYLAEADGRSPRKISGAGYAAVPRWSPDGRRLTFIKAEASRPRVWNVWVADLVSGETARVTRHTTGQAWGASWFPDGQRVAYSVEDTLMVARVTDGSTRILAVPHRGRLIRTPAVSPDGHSIVFQVYRDGVWLLDLPTNTTRRISSDPAAEEFAWAPDGSRIVFHTKRNGAWSVWQLQLHSGAS